VRYQAGGVVAALAAAALLAGCGSAGSTATGNSATSTTAKTTSSSSRASTGTLTVFAAASLKKAFTKLGGTFEQQNPGSKVTFSFAGSSDLVAQLIAGNSADVFASADATNMGKATSAGLVDGTPINFATNTLTIVVPPSNPAKITSFADLAKPGLALVMCAAQVPCGSAAKKLESTTGIMLKPVSEESSVTDVLTKVTTGEADAGLVYVTDAAAAGDKIKAIAFPQSKEVVNTYPIALLKESKNPGLAKKFTDLVTGSQGQQDLKAAGFAPAP
jgi:molybdate transport system substrate-binding protein